MAHNGTEVIKIEKDTLEFLESTIAICDRCETYFSQEEIIFIENQAENICKYCWEKENYDKEWK